MFRLIRKITPGFLLSWYHLGLAFLGTLIYRFPSQGMVVIGVTGTNGKSTTVGMVSRIFREAGFKTASLSSIRFQILDKEWGNTMKMTMPGRFVIQKFLRQAKDTGCTHFVLEVTSEGMLQHRHRFINFHTAVFTNLSPEHIERHGSFENYKRTKGKLFQITKQVHVVNADDEHAPYFLQFSAKQTYSYGLEGSLPKPGLGISLGTNVVANEQGLRFLVEGVEFRLNLLGKFNVSNALAAIAVARSFGISLQVCSRALVKMEVVPGRMETVVHKPFRVVVDYAFTPVALEKVYQTLKPSAPGGSAPGGKLICILGAAGGGRDRWKRPVLGKLAGTYCDKVIVTNEDPYEENPMDIIEQVAKGAESISINQPNQHESAVYKILDRREAIKEALSRVQPGDVVVITGKGSEDSIAVQGGKKIPWDDREVVREEMQAKEKGLSLMQQS